MTTRQLTLEQVEDLAFHALAGAGANEMSARSLARAVADAEAIGMASHGLAYVPTYCEHLGCGKVVGTAMPIAERTAAGAVMVDAASGFAHPAIDAGFELLVPAARETGVAGMGVFNSYNCVVLGYHAERLAREGMLGLGFTNAPASIAPVGGSRPVIGTNPFAVAVPGEGGDASLVIDQSASVVAKSEIMVRARNGESIPEGWALDADGRPTTDPAVALNGSMMPSGGYKGFNAGLLVELLAAALSGAVLGKDASPFSGTAGGPPRTGQFFIAIDPGAFSGAAFAERVQAVLQAINAQDGARAPGARRLANRRRFAAAGVEVAQDLIDRVAAYCFDINFSFSEIEHS